MQLTSAHLELLACPVCHGALVFNSRIKHGAAAAIECAACHRLYPIVDGLPVLIADRSTQAMP